MNRLLRCLATAGLLVSPVVLADSFDEKDLVPSGDPTLDQPAGGPCLALVLESHPAVTRPGPSFSIQEVVDLEAVLTLAPGLSGDHLVELELRSPRDERYLVVPVPVTLGEGPVEPAVRRVGDLPRPLPVRVVEETPEGGLELRERLPVAGTTMVSASLLGRWRVDVALDGLDCGVAAGFTLGDWSPDAMFVDWFETGDTSSWSTVVP